MSFTERSARPLPPVEVSGWEPLIGCVRELPAVVHERSAWVRHVLTPDPPDLPGYLANVLPAGPVGGP